MNRNQKLVSSLTSVMAFAALSQAVPAPSASLSALMLGQLPQNRGEAFGKIGTTKMVFTASTPVEFSLNSMRYRDQDDFVGDDEPYMMNISFRAKVIVDGLGNAKTDPATVVVAPVGSRIQNNLGRTDDGWADSGKTYDIRSGGQLFATTLPQEPGWIAGMFCTFWEEDNFSSTQCRLTQNELVRKITAALKTMNLTALNDKTFSQMVGIRLVNDVRAAIRLGDFSTFLKGIASTVNPDDFGGVNLVIASTYANNSIKAFAGPVTATDSFVNMTELPRPGTGGNQVLNIGLNYPAGTLPGNFFSKFEGSAVISGTIRRS